MKLSALQQRRDFALLGPGFTGRGFALVEGLEAGDGPLIVAPYEGSAQGFNGALQHLDALELDVPPAKLAPVLDDGDHAKGVETIRAAIAAGDVYQVNLTLRARLGPVDGAALLAAMCARGIPRFAAWVRLPDGRELVSASPELFFELDGPKVRAEPMKGTAARGAGGALEASEKDRAELAMITDLLRNDLTPVCVPRSVQVACERRLIELPYAIQTVSEVVGTLLPGLEPIDVLDALHPGGSITGAPKRAAMAMIRALEPSPRGLYCGALGLCLGERAVFSLLIRTASRVDGGWIYGVGGGIVFDSSPQAELEEIHVKLGALRCATPSQE